jgi:hypothetical protein
VSKAITFCTLFSISMVAVAFLAGLAGASKLAGGAFVLAMLGLFVECFLAVLDLHRTSSE